MMPTHSLKVCKWSTGVPVLETKMSSDYFGEGMCLYPVTGRGGAASSRLIQITWKENEAFIYNSKTLKEIGRIPFETSNGEGWGITFDTAKDVLYVTDGSSTLHTWNIPTDSDIFGNVQSIDSTREVQVYSKRRNQRRLFMENLNELEYDDADGTVLANIWQQDTIVRINPRNGFVRKIYNMSSLYPRTERAATADVLNGIAKVPNGTPNEFLITGKKWPWIYRVRFDE
jgi:glutaminyl-peptide cyclotransferase